MRRLIRTLLTVVFVIAILAVAALLFGPRDPIHPDRPREVAVGTDVDAWLAAREAQVPGIIPGAEKQVIWAGNPGEKTPVAIVYVHGFSATLQEIRPVPDRLAAALGANLFYTRLTGHGLKDGTGMAEATPDRWLDDMAEALAVGRAIGEKVIVIGTSTGGTLAALALASPAMAERVAGVIFVSPNFRVRAAGAELLALPFARSFVPLITGPERCFEAGSEAHAKWWTMCYPAEALVPMGTAVKAANAIDFSSLKVPALFVFSPDDQVVDESRTAEIAAQWGGKAEVFNVTPGPGDSPSAHVIAGDIRSPGLTDAVAAKMIEWSRSVLGGG
ncbi:MAG: alpha/beta hydrolase [Alphaproteobacteria bacterium]|nr:MAG: alpha/beta hydrolase [Alphaproteobacteria bacterium]